MCTEARARGFSLIELILFIVIVGAALAGVLAVLDSTVLRSADPLQAKQAISVGEAFLDEIASRDYAANPTYSGAATDPRSNFDDIGDYNGYTATGIRTRDGATTIAGLEAYQVSVAVAAEATLNGASMRQITVTVTDPAGRAYPFTTYKANY